jgi:predicted DNA-binding transcriptional regulator YafY
MTRLIRLTNILIHLQTKRKITAQELADKFDISLRTVYRDIRVLEEAGVPVIGEAGTGYSLMEGYRIPPVMFNEQEINALLTAKKLLQKNTDKSFAENLDSIITKIKAIIRYSEKEKAEILEERVQVFADEKPASTNFLSTIQSAIVNRIILKIKYHALSTDAITERFVEPLAAYFTQDKWVMIAFCRLRNDLREFRIDRILHLTTNNTTFADRHFSLEDYIRS